MAYGNHCVTLQMADTVTSALALRNPTSSAGSELGSPQCPALGPGLPHLPRQVGSIAAAQSLSGPSWAVELDRSIIG
jgi:hypothetical protein